MRESHNRIIRALTIVVLLAFPLALALVNPDWVNAGPTLCLHKRITGEDCMGCGLTRAMVAFFHGQLSEALAFNKGVIIAVPMLGILWLRELRRHARILMHRASPTVQAELSP